MTREEAQKKALFDIEQTIKKYGEDQIYLAAPQLGKNTWPSVKSVNPSSMTFRLRIIPMLLTATSSLTKNLNELKERD